MFGGLIFAMIPYHNRSRAELSAMEVPCLMMVLEGLDWAAAEY